MMYINKFGIVKTLDDFGDADTGFEEETITLL